MHARVRAYPMAFFKVARSSERTCAYPTAFLSHARSQACMRMERQGKVFSTFAVIVFLLLGVGSLLFSIVLAKELSPPIEKMVYRKFIEYVGPQ
jgi:hypothetical protein